MIEDKLCHLTKYTLNETNFNKSLNIEATLHLEKMKENVNEKPKEKPKEKIK